MRIVDEFEVNFLSKTARYQKTILVFDEADDIPKEKLDKLKRLMEKRDGDIILAGPLVMHNPLLEFKK